MATPDDTISTPVVISAPPIATTPKTNEDEQDYILLEEDTKELHLKMMTIATTFSEVKDEYEKKVLLLNRLRCIPIKKFIDTMARSSSFNIPSASVSSVRSGVSATKKRSTASKKTPGSQLYTRSSHTSNLGSSRGSTRSVGGSISSDRTSSSRGGSTSVNEFKTATPE